jgi:hypothetical protein
MNDRAETEYIGSLENVISALVKSGIVLPAKVQKELDELARANSDLCDTLHMDGNGIYVFEGKCQKKEGDGYIEYFCTSKEGNSYKLTVFPNPESKNWGWRYKLKTLTGSPGDDEATGTSMDANLHRPMHGVDGPDAWLDSFTAMGFVFHYDNIDKDYVMKLDGPRGGLEGKMEYIRTFLAGE